jgi:hypothetical protein
MSETIKNILLCVHMKSGFIRAIAGMRGDWTGVRQDDDRLFVLAECCNEQGLFQWECWL